MKASYSNEQEYRDYVLLKSRGMKRNHGCKEGKSSIEELQEDRKQTKAQGPMRQILEHGLEHSAGAPGQAGTACAPAPRLWHSREVAGIRSRD